MKNKEELLEAFNDKIWGLSNEFQDDLRELVFETIIKEVIKNIIYNYGDYNDGCGCCASNELGSELKKYTKENFGIEL